MAGTGARPAARCPAPRRPRRRRAWPRSARPGRPPSARPSGAPRSRAPSGGARTRPACLRCPVPRRHLRVDHVERADQGARSCSSPPAQQVGGGRLGDERPDATAPAASSPPRVSSCSRSGRRCRGGGPGRHGPPGHDGTGARSVARPPPPGTPAPSSRSDASHISLVPCSPAMTCLLRPICRPVVRTTRHRRSRPRVTACVTSDRIWPVTRRCGWADPRGASSRRPTSRQIMQMVRDADRRMSRSWFSPAAATW